MNKMLEETPGAELDTPRVAKTEEVIRVELAAAYRLVDYFGWCELIYGHLTAKVPGPENHFLINPYGLNYDEVTASNLVKIDLDGNKVDPDCEHPVSVAGFVIHSAIHMAHSEQNQVVMHTHSRSGMAIAALEEGLLPVSMGSTALYGHLSYHDYEGVSLYLDERDRLVEALGSNQSMILRNHGLLSTGRTVADAFLRHYRIERAAQVQLDASAAGTLRVLDTALAKKSGDEVNQFAAIEKDTGALEFAALMRKLDKLDASYRQ